MTDEQPAAPPSGQAAPEPQAPAPTPGQAKEPVDDVPEKFKGKSAAEIAKSYLELEKEHGKHSKEVKEAREEIEKWQALGGVIKGNPALTKAIQDEIDKISGKKEDSNTENKQTVVTDTSTKRALENQIINKFEEDRGLKLIPQEKKQELDKAIGRELVDMLDPTGTKTPSEILASIPTDRLPTYLEKAYVLATASDKEERGRSQVFIDARRNAMATIGSMPSSGVNNGSIDLTPGQKEAARRMNISEEDYKKQLVEIQKGN